MTGDLYKAGQYLERNPTYHVEDSAWKAHQILRMLEKHRVEPMRVCEVGCGAGEILAQLQTLLATGTRFDGFDVSPVALELSASRANEHLTFYCEDFTERECEPYDLLLCIDVFEHVEDYIGFLRKLRGKAKYKIFHIPLEMSVSCVLRVSTIRNARNNAGHLHYFCKDTALLTLRDAGYEVIDVQYTGSGTDLARTVKSRVASIPRRLARALAPDLGVRIFGGYSLLVLAS